MELNPIITKMLFIPLDPGVCVCVCVEEYDTYIAVSFTNATLVGCVCVCV